MIHFSGSTTAIWYLTILFHLALVCLLAFKQGAAKRFPAFTFLMCFVAVKKMALLYCSLFLPVNAYVFTYFSGSFAASSIAIFVLVEIYLDTFGPSRSLPPGTPLKMMTAIAASYVAALGCGHLLSPAHVQTAVSALFSIDKVLVAFLTVSLWAIALYAKALGIPWRVHGATFGLIFYLSFAFVAAHLIFLTSSATMESVTNLTEISYLCALLIWFRVLWVGEPSLLPDEEILSIHRHTMSAATQWIE